MKTLKDYIKWPIVVVLARPLVVALLLAVVTALLAAGLIEPGLGEDLLQTLSE